MFKSFIHSQLLKPIFCPRTVVKLRQPKIFKHQNIPFHRTVTSPLAVQLFLLPFSFRCSTQNIGFNDSGYVIKPLQTKFRYLRNSAFYRESTKKTASCNRFSATHKTE